MFYDERDNKNEFATYEQINDRQAKELRDLLNRWENGTTPPWDIMLELSQVVGASAAFLSIYSSSLEYGPGTLAFEKEVAGWSEKIRDRANNVDRFAQRQAKEILEWVEDLKKKYADLNHEAIRSRSQGLLDKKIAEAPELAKPFKINDDIQGSRTYVDTVQNLIRARDNADNDLFKLIFNDAIAAIRLEKKQAEYDAAHLEETIARLRHDIINEHQAMLAKMKAKFRPEALDHALHQTVIAASIREIRINLDIDDFDSWAAAEAMAEVLLLPPTGEEHIPTHSPILDFKDSLQREKARAEAHRQDNKNTLDQFTPITEESIKAPLARKYATERAYQVWREKKVADYKKENGGKEPEASEFDRWAYDLYGQEGAPEDDEDVPFLPNTAYPDHPLCNEIHIVPSGTALIAVSQIDPAHDFGASTLDLARLTTYSISFVPKNPADAEALETLLAEALKLLGAMDYKYDLPGYTNVGESYKRVAGPNSRYREHGTTASSYIDIKDGKVTPQARFDLDDLWRLYFLMEPIIEPSAQIATAMNAARYDEERGAILAAPEHGVYAHDFETHEVTEKLGYLKKENEPDLLAAAARDLLVQRALNKIDNAGLLMGMAVLAGQTLTGRMPDIHGAFPTFDNMLANMGQHPDGALITYDEALRERTTEMMRCLVGLPKDSHVSVPAALSAVLSKIEKPLQEKYRAASKADQIAAWDRYEQRSREWNQRIANGWDPLKEINAGMNEHEIALKLSDIFAGLAGRTEEEAQAARKNAVTERNALVIADSAVEPALDGLHRGGWYQTRTKGSPHVRYELPKSLERFNPKGRYQPSPKLLIGLKL